jgi:hypothetical protein
MANPAPANAANLGFLTILHEQAGYVGGYLVTNPWGRPLEFRLSSAVQPNKVQQILYGPTLEPYLCSDLIGKKLIEKAATNVQYVFTDHPAALDLRLQVDMPVGLMVGAIRLAGADAPGLPVTDFLRCHAHFADDVSSLKTLLERLGGSFDLNDPFLRIREALAEARKLGVANRAA